MSDKNLVYSIQKIFFWRLFSSYDIWNLGEKWTTYDVNPDHFKWRNSAWKSFFPSYFWQLLCLVLQLLNKSLVFNGVDSNRFLFLSSLLCSYKNWESIKKKRRYGCFLIYAIYLRRTVMLSNFHIHCILTIYTIYWLNYKYLVQWYYGKVLWFLILKNFPLASLYQLWIVTYI